MYTTTPITSLQPVDRISVQAHAVASSRISAIAAAENLASMQLSGKSTLLPFHGGIHLLPRNLPGVCVCDASEK